ncbi:MAG: RIP metalloprotease RseP [Gemmatimonadales bacterium]|nr:RIP metalloprotease RseP [Gemmatimonadales bacterium]NIN11677.1 RIP metalloprotease RseP [Gemmatimonadales bacterium]NIN50283.1 RIP metalloprotease RseP [Gemmatimonadales bacterium]NIP07747.1 RIP metalloprotease RseP [Gemmatimonadales bacterium]NIQ99150.1 RIP metalloprotease RseP [Gemmatimonadales bacterium]
MLVTIAAFVFVLGVLIFVHELGHFLAAKAVGVGVPRFSIGFGSPTPLRFRRGETEYVVAWFPLGGYVKMASKEEQEAMAPIEGGQTADEFPADKLFENKPLPARIIVICAGVAMNMLFAWVAYTGLAAAYGRTEDATTAVGRVDSAALPSSAAPLAQVPFGATVIRVNGDTVRSWQEMMRAVLDPTSAELRLDFAGDIEPLVLPVRGIDTEARAAIASAMWPAWEPRAGAVAAASPAAEAGVEPGDLMVAVNGDTVRGWHDIPPLVEDRAGDTVRFAFLRGDSLFERAIVPAERTIRDPLSGEVRTVGQIGFGVPDITLHRVQYGLGGAVVQGARDTWSGIELVLFTLKGIITRQISTRELAGPLLIGQMSGQIARVGIRPLIAFMALISVNLAILNLLPIPVLDGGHLLFLIAEGVRGKPLSLALRLRLTQLGVVLLLGLMVLVFTNDILRLFGG